jgi:hypothetical protein
LTEKFSQCGVRAEMVNVCNAEVGERTLG